MAGVEAVGDREVGLAGCEIADHSQLFEALADLVASAGGVFEEHGQTGGAEFSGGFGESECEGGESVFERLVFVIAGVDDEVVGADGFGTVEFAAERGDGFLADIRIERGEVDQVVGMDDEGREVEAFAGGAEAADVVRVRRGGSPLAGAGGENLEGVRAEAVGFEGGLLEGFGAGGVDSDSQNGYRSRSRTGESRGVIRLPYGFTETP